MSDAVSIKLNGAPTELPAGATVVDALASLGIAPDAKGVAVARGLEVVRRADWPSVTLADGDEVEVVTAAQGG